MKSERCYSVETAERRDAGGKPDINQPSFWKAKIPIASAAAFCVDELQLFFPFLGCLSRGLGSGLRIIAGGGIGSVFIGKMTSAGA